MYKCNSVIKTKYLAPFLMIMSFILLGFSKIFHYKEHHSSLASINNKNY